MAVAQKQSAPKVDSPKKIKKKLPLILGIGIPVLILLIIGIASAMVYILPSTDPMVRSLSRSFPYPAVIINGESVRMKDFLAERDALEIYFASQGQIEEAPEGEDLDREIVDTLINKKALELVALSHGIELDEGQVDQMYEGVVNAPGGTEETFLAEVKETFGWDREEFRARVLDSIVLAVQVGEFVAGDENYQEQPKAQINAALERLNAGEAMDIVAGEINTDSSAALGGDIGDVNVQILPVEWFKAIDALEQGDRTDIIETTDAYAIIEIIDKTPNAENKTILDSVHLRVVRVQKRSLEEIIDDYVDQAKIKRLVGKEV